MPWCCSASAPVWRSTDEGGPSACLYGPERRGRLAAGGLVLLAATVLGACGTATPGVSASPKPLEVVPKGAEIVHPSPPPQETSCNATASLPPPATMPTPGRMPAGSYMAQIRARGYLRVGVDQNTYLWGYRDPATGQLTRLRHRHGASRWRRPSSGRPTPGTSATVIVPNAERVQAVQDGEVDIVAETMTINCEREKSVDFSTVYYQAGQQILVPSDSSITGPQDLGGKRVCATQGSTSLQNLVATSMPRHIRLWAVPDETDCLVMLQQGQVDAISTDDAILVGLEAQDPNTKIVGATFSSEPYGMAISKTHPDFTSFVNGVLAASPGERDLDPDLQRVARQIHPHGGTSSAACELPVSVMAKVTLREIDRRIEDIRSLLDVTTGRLVELDADVTRQLLESSTSLRGVTADTWADASSRHAALWRGPVRARAGADARWWRPAASVGSSASLPSTSSTTSSADSRSSSLCPTPVRPCA